MSFDNAEVKRPLTRARIFEIVLALLIIGALFAIAARQLFPTDRTNERPVVEFQAGVFSRTIQTIHALGRASKNKFVEIDNFRFYLNEKGYPANTDPNASSSLKNQTSEECLQLWEAVFFVAPSSKIQGDNDKSPAKVEISLMDSYICRYQLRHNKEDSLFLDYDVSNGMVTVGRPGS